MGLLYIDNGGHKLVAIYNEGGTLKDTVYHSCWSQAVRAKAVATTTATTKTAATAIGGKLSSSSSSIDPPNTKGQPSAVRSNNKSAPATATTTTTRLVTAVNCVGIDCDGNRHVGNALLSLKEYHDLILRRPVERGYIVDFALQAHIWLNCVIEPLQILDEGVTDLVLSLPYGMPDEVCEGLEQLCFKQFNFRSVTLVGTTFLSMLGQSLVSSSNKDGSSIADGEKCRSSPAGAKRPRQTNDERLLMGSDVEEGGGGGPEAISGIVIDAGFSGTTIVPYLWGRAVKGAIVHINIGGKHLTNFLKQIISFSQVDLLGDTWLCNEIKERCCFVSPVFGATMSSYLQWKQLSHFDRKDLVKLIEAEKKKDEESVEGGAVGGNSVSSTVPWPPMVLQYLLPTVGPTKPLGRLLPTANTPEAVALKQQLRPHKHQLQHVTLKQEAMVVGEMVFSPGVVMGGTVKGDGGGDGASAGGGQPVLGLTDVLIRGLWQDRTRQNRSPLYHAPLALREVLLSNVVLCGGTGCNMPGYAQRINHDLQANMPSSLQKHKANPQENTHTSSVSNPFDVSVCSDVHHIPLLPSSSSSSYEVSSSTAAPPTSFLVRGALGLLFSLPPPIIHEGRNGNIISSSSSTTATYHSIAIATMLSHSMSVLLQQSKRHHGGVDHGGSAAAGQQFPPTTVERAHCSREALRIASALML